MFGRVALLVADAYDLSLRLRVTGSHETHVLLAIYMARVIGTLFDVKSCRKDWSGIGAEDSMAVRSQARSLDRLGKASEGDVSSAR